MLPANDCRDCPLVPANPPHSMHHHNHCLLPVTHCFSCILVILTHKHIDYIHIQFPCQIMFLLGNHTSSTTVTPQKCTADCTAAEYRDQPLVYCNNGCNLFFPAVNEGMQIGFTNKNSLPSPQLSPLPRKRTQPLNKRPHTHHTCPLPYLHTRRTSRILS